MTPELLFLGSLLGIGALCAVVFIIRHESDAYLGRELRKAAGDESHARLAIESANLDRLLRQKYDAESARLDAETDARMRRGIKKLPRNVVRLVPRYRDGRPVPFLPTDGAA